MINQSKKVSIIVPVFNIQKYISSCIESITAQTYTNIEIILINDGSTDNSGAVCARFATQDARITCINQENSGLSSARNKGLSLAKGDFVFFCDGDDMLDPRTIELLISSWDGQLSTIVIGGYDTFTDKPKPISFSQEAPRTIASSRYLAKRVLELHQNTYAWGVLIPIGIARNISFPIGRYYEDLSVFHLLLSPSYRLILLSLPIYKYRQQDSSITHNLSPRKINDYRLAAEIFVKNVLQFYPSLKGAANGFLLYVYSTCALYDEGNFQKYRDALIRIFNFRDTLRLPFIVCLKVLTVRYLSGFSKNILRIKKCIEKKK